MFFRICAWIHYPCSWLLESCIRSLLTRWEPRSEKQETEQHNAAASFSIRAPHETCNRIIIPHVRNYIFYVMFNMVNIEYLQSVVVARHHDQICHYNISIVKIKIFNPKSLLSESLVWMLVYFRKKFRIRHMFCNHTTFVLFLPVTPDLGCKSMSESTI